MLRRWIDGPDAPSVVTDTIADVAAVLALAVVLWIGYVALELWFNAPV